MATYLTMGCERELPVTMATYETMGCERERCTSFSSLPPEVVSIVALHGPLLALRQVSRFDVRVVAQTRIARWFRLRAYRRACPSVGDRVVVRWPSFRSMRPSFGTVAGSAGRSVDGMQQWKIRLLDGQYTKTHFIWHLRPWADVDGADVSSPWVDSVGHREALAAASTARRAAARATAAATAAMCSTTCPAEAALAMAAASAACTAAAAATSAATSAAHATSSASGLEPQNGPSESASLLTVAHRMQEAISGSEFDDHAGSAGSMGSQARSAQALGYAPRMASTAGGHGPSTQDALRMDASVLHTSGRADEAGGGVGAVSGMGPVPQLLAEAAAAATDAAAEATAAAHAARAIESVGSLAITTVTAATAMSAAESVRAAASLLADAGIHGATSLVPEGSSGLGEAASRRALSAAAEEMAADAIAEVGLAGRELTATWASESAAGSPNAISYQAAALLRSIAANRMGGGAGGAAAGRTEEAAACNERHGEKDSELKVALEDSLAAFEAETDREEWRIDETGVAESAPTRLRTASCDTDTDVAPGELTHLCSTACACVAPEPEAPTRLRTASCHADAGAVAKPMDETQRPGNPPTVASMLTNVLAALGWAGGSASTALATLHDWCPRTLLLLSGLEGSPRTPPHSSGACVASASGAVGLSGWRTGDRLPVEPEARTNCQGTAMPAGCVREHPPRSSAPAPSPSAAPHASAPFSLLAAMANQPLDGTSTMISLIALRTDAALLGALFRATRVLAANGRICRQQAETRILNALELQRASLTALRDVDWSGCQLTVRQWWHVGCWLLPQQPLEQVTTLRAGEHSMPIAEWRREYASGGGRYFVRHPAPLQLKSEGIGAADLAVVFSFAAGGGMPGLRELELSACADGDLGDLAISLFARAVGRGAMYNLWSITFEALGITSCGASTLASALASRNEAGPQALKKLMYLRLTRNEIGSAGAGALANALGAGAATSLCVIDLRENPTTGSGTERLLTACASRDIDVHLSDSL